MSIAYYPAMSRATFARALLAALLALAAVTAHADSAVAAKMRAAAESLVAGVDPAKRGNLLLRFDSVTRVDWHYTPRSHAGLSFAELAPAQREAVHRLLRIGLSAIGHRKVVNIIELELVLKEIETFGLLRDPEKYSIAIFGEPSAKAPWGWRFEGHHLSLNFTLDGDLAVVDTPSFFGANPAEVPQGARKGLRVLAAEEDEARKLLGMLDVVQRATAVIDSRSYGDIVTRNADKVSPLDNRGLEARAMNDGQKAQLKKIIETYAANFEETLRDARMARAAEGFDSIRFAWAGATAKGHPHYYRVQGPRFLIEYDASQNDGNHIHTVWRDFDGDFGRDLLKEHYSATNGTRHKH
jgi:hypothetical protein